MSRLSSASSTGTSHSDRTSAEIVGAKSSFADTVPGGWAVSPPKRKPSPVNNPKFGKTSSGRSTADFDRGASGSLVAYVDDPSLRLMEMRKSPGLEMRKSANLKSLAGRSGEGSFASAQSRKTGSSFNGSSGSGRIKQKALLIGVNYAQTRGTPRLTGSVNDTKLIYRTLVDRFGFKDDSMWVLTDEPIDVGAAVRQFQPTKSNIMNGMRWLLHGSSSGDSLFFFFAGHGGQVRDTNGDELDGWDETLLPSDYPTAGQIVDDDIHKIMVRGLCGGATMTAVIDAGYVLEHPRL